MSRWKTSLRFWGSIVVLGVVMRLSAALAYGQAQEAFEPAKNLGKDALPAGPLLYSAYALVWLVLIGYLFLLWRRLDRVEKELRDVSARLASGKRS